MILEIESALPAICCPDITRKCQECHLFSWCDGDPSLIGFLPGSAKDAAVSGNLDALPGMA